MTTLKLFWIIGCLSSVLCLSSSASADTFVVNTTGDAGVGSLRAALEGANAIPNSTITFNIPSSDPNFDGTTWTIRPTSGLPPITAASTIIDGSSQEVFAGNTNLNGPEIVLSGTGLPSQTFNAGFLINAPGCVVRALVINGFIEDAAISIGGFGSGGVRDTVIEGCYLGTNAGATAGVPNGRGIVIGNGASSNRIGGPSTSARNIISGNTEYGVLIQSVGANANLIVGNYIGVDRSGNAALPNIRMGIYIVGGPQGNLVGAGGGTDAAARNVISGNIDYGVLIESPGTDGNRIEGNIIGLNAEGTALLTGANNKPDVAGVAIAGGAKNNVIGGTSAAARNVISGNGAPGVTIADAGTSGNLVAGNFIGTDISGTRSLGNASHGVLVGAPDNLIGGQSTLARNVISGNALAGIGITGALGDFATGNVVQGNIIGLNASASAKLPNGDGVVLSEGARNNTVGGTTDGAGNVISGNSQNGVVLDGASTSNNLIQGNLIGTDGGGTVAMPNLIGLLISGGASSHTVGGEASGARNVISGNALDGIVIRDIGTKLNGVQGNFIGLNAAGSGRLANGRNGLSIESGATQTVVGGQTQGARNIISGNTRSGVFIAASSNVVQGNIIGLNAAGSGAIGNGTGGVTIGGGAQRNLIGGAQAAMRNVISGNANQGVAIGGSGASFNDVQGNYIGTDVSGRTAVPNGAGVRISSGAGGNRIGGAVGNRIWFNTRWGVFVTHATTKSNSILGNSISRNGYLGIDLLSGPEAENTVTANDAGDKDDGANRLQNFPVITGAVQNGTNVVIVGVLNSTPNLDFTLEFFANTIATPSGFGQGERRITSTKIHTDASGNVAFKVTVAGQFLNQRLTATATSIATTDTSEFSRAVLVTAAPLISSFTPVSGVVGTVVTITGANLDGATSVTFNGKAAEFTQVSTTTLRAIVPAGATSGRLAVVTPNGTALSATGFTVSRGTGQLPRISGFTPSSGPAGTSVLIEGSNFLNVRRVFFNGLAASFTTLSAMQVRAVVPPGATSGRLTLSAEGGLATSAGNFVVTQVITAPIISSFTPGSGPVGTLITIEGSNFGGISAVRFNGVAARFIPVSNTRLQAVVPNGSVTGRVSVTTAAGTGVSRNVFTVTTTTDNRAAITAISPGFGTVGASVTISGNNLSSASLVRFNGVAASFQVLQTSQIVARVPAGASNGAISVVTQLGEVRSPGSFLVLKAPIIDSFTPTSGNAATGTIVTINGRGFTGATAVRFGTVAQTNFTIASDTRLLVPLPTLPSGSYPVSVVTPGGTGTAAQRFAVVGAAPTITDFSPSIGRGGTQVVITGTNLGGALYRFAGGSFTTATQLSDDGTQILVTAPALVQAGPITVMTSGGTVRTADNFILQVICVRGICTGASSLGEAATIETPNADSATSPIGLSQGRVVASSQEVVLTFGGALDRSGATSAGSYLVVVDGREVPIENAGYDPIQHVVRLRLPDGTVSLHMLVSVTWRGLHDAQGRAILTAGSTFVAR